MEAAPYSLDNLPPSFSPSLMFLTPPLSSYSFPPPLPSSSPFSQLGVSFFPPSTDDLMSSSAISSPPTASSSLGHSTSSMAILAAAAAAGGTGSEPSSGSEGGQQLITKHLAPVKRGGRTKKPSTKAQEALDDSTSHARPSPVPRTPSAPSQARVAPPPPPPSNGVHQTPPAQFTPAQHQQYSQQPQQGPPSAGWEPRAGWDAPGSSSSSMSGGPYAGGAQFYDPGHPSSSTTPSHLVPQHMQSSSQSQHYYYPSQPSHYASSPSYVDRSVSPYPPPPRSNHSHPSSNGQLFSPSLHGPYSVGPPSNYSGGLAIASSPAAPSPLNHYPPPPPLAYPSHFVSSSTPLQPFHPHPPPLPSLQQRATASPAPSKTSVSSKSIPKDKDGTTPKKTPRKYTKKADYWVENGGQGRKGPGKKAAAAGTSVSSAPSFEGGLASLSSNEIAPPTPPPSGSTPVPSRRLPSLSSTETLVAKSESVGSEAGGELARLRSEEEESEKAKEEKRPGWLKRSRKEGRKGRGVEVAQAEGAGQGRRLDLWQPKTPVADTGSFASSSEEGTRTSGSTPPPTTTSNPTRLISPLSPSRRANKPTTSFSSLPRTVSAPTLLTSSDGKATLSSTQILASEMAWLVPLHPRQVQPNTSSTSIFVEEDEETKLAREEKKRRRLLAFQKDGMDFFASPETERTRSLSRSQSSSNLVAARVVGVGRVAMGAGTLSAMEEAGTAQKVWSPTKGKGSSVERPRGRITRPNWPENVYPWGEPEREKIEALGEERKVTLSTVQRYLESSDDDDSEGEEGRFPANPLDGSNWRNSSSSSSTERIMTVPTPASYMELSSSRRGGKSSYGLIGDNIKRTRVRSVRSFANLGPKSFDPSDARQALLLKRQASSTFSMSQFRNVVSRDHLVGRERRQEEEEEDESAVIGCICREEVDGDGGMVECDCCKTWHHLDCIGLDEDDLGAEWFCWKCAPGEQLSVPYEDEEPLSTSASSALLRTPNLQSAQPNFTNNSPSIALSPAQSLALAPSPMFGGRTNGGTPIQRFGTPRLVSSSSYSSAATTIPGTTPHPAQSPQSSRPRPSTSHDFGDSIGLGTPSSGPSRSSWDSGRNLSTPKFGDFDPADDHFFDLTSTPSRHLGRELPFGGTPNSRKRSGPGAFGRLAFTTPSQSQEFFHGLAASPRIPSTSSGPTPSLDHYPSSVDSSGPLSPYQPSARWSAAHPSPSVYGQNRQASASRTSLFGGEGTTPRARTVSKSAMASEPWGGERRVREHVRFGEPLGEPMKEQQRGLGFGIGQEEFGAEL